MLLAFRTMGRRGGQRLHAGVHAPEAVFQLPCRSHDMLGRGAMDQKAEILPSRPSYGLDEHEKMESQLLGCASFYG